MAADIRPFTPDDYGALVALTNRVYEKVITQEELRWHDENLDPRCRQARWLAEAEGRVVGAGYYTQYAAFYHPQKFEVVVMVEPEFRRRGIGSALYQQVMAGLAPLNPIHLSAGARETWPESLAFLAARSFTEAMRQWDFVLDVTRFDPTPWAGLMQQVADQGYVIKSLAELPDDLANGRKLFDLVVEVREDVPSTVPRAPLRFESWIKGAQSPWFYPEGNLVVMKGEEWVGLSTMRRTGEADLLAVGLTAVRRAHRGVGLAQALKVRAIQVAREAGFARIKTTNESNNRPILAINEKMGFERKPAWIFFERHLSPVAAQSDEQERSLS
ncbi:MAG: GNAT family N-acetyltransferase [Bacillota bacterium]